MTTIITPVISPITPVLFALADCVCEELATVGAGPTCWCGLVPGAVVSWEFCSDCSNGVCGMGYVRLAGAAPYNVFPVSFLDFNCASPIAYQVEVGALRCIPVNDDGSLPPPEVLAEVTAAQLADSYALHRAFLCCDAASVALEQYVPVGPEGGCVGGFWTGFVAVD